MKNKNVIIGITSMLIITLIVVGIMMFLPIAEEEQELESNNNFACPLQEDFMITASFGERWGSFHDGVDLAAIPYGTNVYSIAYGVVERAVIDDDERGKYIVIRHADDMFSKYAHLSDINVEIGQFINRLDMIGTVGSSGMSTATHLHFGLFMNDYSLTANAIDPAIYIDCI